MPSCKAAKIINNREDVIDHFIVVGKGVHAHMYIVLVIDGVARWKIQNINSRKYASIKRSYCFYFGISSQELVRDGVGKTAIDLKCSSSYFIIKPIVGVLKAHAVIAKS